MLLVTERYRKGWGQIWLVCFLLQRGQGNMPALARKFMLSYKSILRPLTQIYRLDKETLSDIIHLLLIFIFLLGVGESDLEATSEFADV